MTSSPTARHSRRGLLIPFGIVGLALVLWTIWWLVLARQVETRLAERVDGLRADGWTIDYQGGGVNGWPFRARVALDQVRVLAPSGHGVAAPALVAQANAYNPGHWMLIAPEALTLFRPGKGQVTVDSEAARLSISRLREPFPDLRVQLVRPRFTPAEGAEAFPVVSAEGVELYTRPHLTDGRPEADRLDVLFRLLDARGRTGGPVEGVARQGRMTIEIEATLDRASRLAGPDAAGIFANWIEAGGRFTAVRGEVSAGASRARVSSEVLSADADGRLQGVVALSAERPMEAIAGLARAPSGAVNRPQAAAAAGAASAAEQAEGQRPVELTIQFRDGRTWLGPFALAPAPKLF